MSDTFRVSNIYTSTVGIGTATTTSILSIVGSTTVYNGNGLLTLSNTNTNPQGVMYVLGPNMSTGSQMGCPIGSALTTYNSLNLGFYYIGLGSTSNYYQINSYGNPNPGLVVTTGGNIGIGTTNPSNLLHIYGTAAQLLQLQNTSTYSRMILNGATGTGGDIIFQEAGTSKYGIACISGKLQFLLNDSTSTVSMTLDASGNVGIGTASPSTKLHVNGSTKLGTSGTAFASVVAFSSTISAGTTGVNTYTITFPTAYSDATKLIVNVTIVNQSGTAYSDTFVNTVQSISTASYTLNVVRADASSAWGQTARVHTIVYELV